MSIDISAPPAYMRWHFGPFIADEAFQDASTVHRAARLALDEWAGRCKLIKVGLEALLAADQASLATEEETFKKSLELLAFAEREGCYRWLAKLWGIASPVNDAPALSEWCYLQYECLQEFERQNAIFVEHRGWPNTLAIVRRADSERVAQTKRAVLCTARGEIELGEQVLSLAMPLLCADSENELQEAARYVTVTEWSHVKKLVDWGLSPVTIIEQGRTYLRSVPGAGRRPEPLDSSCRDAKRYLDQTIGWCGAQTADGKVLTDRQVAADKAIRAGCGTLKEISKATGIDKATLTNHVIPALKDKCGLKSKPYRYL